MRIAVAGLVLFASALTACAPPGDIAPQAVAGTGSAGGIKRPAMKVGLVLGIGGRADKSYNATAAAGADRAAAELGLKVTEVTCAAQDGKATRVDRIERLAADNQVVVVVGQANRDAVAEVAPRHPAVRFALVDAVPLSGPNVHSIQFADEQGSFLVGAAAALKTKTNKVGFIGGTSSPVIAYFESGFRAGVKAVNPTIEVQTSYVAPTDAGFDAPQAASEQASAMYAGGVDVVYVAAGRSSRGVFDAARAHGRLAIGADSDQYVTADPAVREVVLTSMVKKLDNGVYAFLTSVADGAFAATVTTYDLKTGGVDYTTSGGRIDDITARLELLKEQIISGEIVVPLAP